MLFAAPPIYQDYPARYQLTGVSLTVTTKVFAFMSDDQDYWCVNTHDERAALRKFRALSDYDPPTEWHIPEFEQVWVLTSANEQGELELSVVPDGTSGAVPAIRYCP